ncbi:MAG TPA: mannose-1-phosphate guanylyltransferase [Flavobacteriales bacterium]|nr:mannose-1-phosphate guanylyltransferase [Flavobacteriales bacterium]
MKDNFAVIMAGGIGSRFWPMSKTAYPKQFHDVLGTGRTLIQMTFDRFKDICPDENIFVVTNEIYKELVLEQLPGISDQQVLCEPSRRNTAPCIAYACYKIRDLNPNANVVVAPSDHLILKEAVYTETINTAIEQARANSSLVTLGIKPSRPDTGYGYIQFVEDDATVSEGVKKVKTFTEKPQLELAKEFLNSGDFYWNSGIFIWTLESIIAAFEAHLPEVDALFKEGEGKYNTGEERAFINEIYPVCKNISIDYGIMEKAKNVYIVLSDFGWSDLGTWGSLYTHIEHDKKENAVVGKNVMLYDSENNIVKVPNEKLVVIQGLTDYIVVESDDTLLICKKEDEQKIKQFVSDIKTNKGDQYV